MRTSFKNIRNTLISNTIIKWFIQKLYYIRNRITNWFIQKLYLRQREEEINRWEKIYGEFDKTNYEDFTLRGLPNEASFYFGEIIKWAQDITPRPRRTLLAGENKNVVKYLQPKIQVKDICTTGLLNIDYEWNFENSPPKMGEFDLIISQAILEHLLNPYKHMCDLASLLAPGGFLIVLTVGPGHPYHRYPIDACRFYPDWFEETAKRLNLDIVKKRVKDPKNNYIFYMFQKSGAESSNKDTSEKSLQHSKVFIKGISEDIVA